ncbi:MAG: hypothetical protein QOC95_1639 [Thermoleophilaceae bacterium]|nr:hypothetical protein [Thermoleophilaceae bacterium]
MSDLQPPAADPTDVVGRRIGAALLDGILLSVIFVVVGIASGGGSTGGGKASVTLGTAGTLVWVAATLVYFIVSEAASGQTVGKRALGIKVVRSDGSRAGAGPIVVRNLLRLVDALPIAYIVGLVTILATGRRRQRIGDMAADTAVVRA